nr:hypothetical protein [Tanacetum cinerariifolium]
DWAKRPGNCGPGGAAPRECDYHGMCSRGSPAERVAATDPPAVKERHKRGHDGVDTNALAKVLRRDHADPRPTESTHGGKSLAAIELGMGSTRPTLAPQGAPVDVSDPVPLSFTDPQSRPWWMLPSKSSKGAAVAGDPESENTSFASMVGSLESIYRPEWGITNGSMLDTPEACQDLVDHVAMGSQLRLRFEKEAKLLKKYVAQVARRDKRIQAIENEIKNLETLLEAEADMKKAAENKSAELSQELENMRALFSDLQVSNNRLSQQVSTLQERVSGEEKLKAAFEEFKQYEDNRVEQRCAEMDARLDALSIDFDKELYPHMLTAIACRRWMIRRGLRLAVMKCGEFIELRQAFADVVSAEIAKGMSEGLKHGVEHGQAKLDLKAIEAYDPKAEAKYIAALHALKNLKYPLVDQLESLKDAPMDVIMASLHLESDTGDDAPQWVRELRPSSSQLTIPVYPEVRDPMDPWACKEEILLADVIAANVSRAEKKKSVAWVLLFCWWIRLHRRRHLMKPFLSCLGLALYLLYAVESIHSTACEVTSFKIGNVLRPWKNCSVHGPQLVCSIPQRLCYLVRSFSLWSYLPTRYCVTGVITARIRAALLTGPGLAVAPHHCLPRLLLQYGT